MELCPGDDRMDPKSLSLCISGGHEPLNKNTSFLLSQDGHLLVINGVITLPGIGRGQSTLADELLISY